MPSSRFEKNTPVAAAVGGPDTPEVTDNPSYRGTAYYWLGYMTENGEGVTQ